MNVKVDYSKLSTLSRRLRDIIDEFDEASARREDLEAAVDRPDGHATLQDRVREFESQWDDRRNQLKDGLENVLERTDKTLEAWQTGDEELAASVESEES
ncbi:hypothetical protein [Agrococcus sp. Marseille-P2731]|uniref:hypothetical protein n=1 Tax=Agrococcus sp. Marseille-P2731 TaxID=1841862 RepID=UPI000931DD04|nr:hypothetical protein [Agrococcus sp. Marseille-P2731]